MDALINQLGKIGVAAFSISSSASAASALRIYGRPKAAVSEIDMIREHHAKITAILAEIDANPEQKDDA